MYVPAPIVLFNASGRSSVQNSSFNSALANTPGAIELVSLPSLVIFLRSRTSSFANLNKISENIDVLGKFSITSPSSAPFHHLLVDPSLMNPLDPY